MHICMNTCMYIHKYMHAHMQIHTNIHIYKLAFIEDIRERGEDVVNIYMADRLG